MVSLETLRYFTKKDNQGGYIKVYLDFYLKKSQINITLNAPKILLINKDKAIKLDIKCYMNQYYSFLWF